MFVPLPLRVVVGLGVLVAIDGHALAQAPEKAATRPSTTERTTQPPTPEMAVLQALASNPITAPYVFRTSRKDGKIVLAGRVGTKEIHDVAVRLAMNVSSSIDDRLVIDTAETYRVANLGRMQPAASATGPVATATTYFSGVPPLVYPPPLFGRFDDPFYGFEPPLISYPPWWGAVAARRGDPYGAPVLDPYSPIGPDPGPAPISSAPPPPQPTQAPGSAGTPTDTVEMTLDPRGVAVLRGSVPTMNDRIAVGQKVARMEGVTEVINLLDVRKDADAPIVPRRNDTPPPPPTPAVMPDRASPVVPPTRNKEVAPKPVTDRAGAETDVDRRLAENLARRPLLNGTTVQASVRDGVAYLSGTVPTALEAMTAFRAAQQTIGVRDVVDRLEFTVPDGQGRNPLIAKGRPEDVEPYLEAQIRRQVGDQAHIDRVHVVGDRLELRGTVPKAEDRPRVDAILRSMPLLRGYTLDATLVPE